MSDEPPAGELTAAQVKSYIERGGQSCPFCGSTGVVDPVGPVQTLGPAFVYQIQQHMHCLDCGKEWTDLYRLTSAQAGLL